VSKKLENDHNGVINFIFLFLGLVLPLSRVKIKPMKSHGRHFLIDFYDCSPVLLNDGKKIESLLKKAAKIAGSQIVGSRVYTLIPHGLTAVVVIKESHLILSSWPEYGWATVDFFTCGQKAKPKKAIDFLIREFGPGKVNVVEVKRGFF